MLFVFCSNSYARALQPGENSEKKNCKQNNNSL